MSEHPKVLIVDDSPINLKLARVALESDGFDVSVATDGHEAWQHLSEAQPAVILMDLQLPGIDGFELTRRIKADPNKRAIKIIAVTAYAMKGDRERALAAGCDGYITKPIDPLLLPGLIASHLGASSVEEREDTRDPIIVVEDNPTSRKLIRVTLESEGYLVREFGEGRAALAWLDERRASMILQDLVLPDIDGLTLLEQFRSRPNGAHVPILCLSGFIARLEEAKLSKHRFSAQLVKPIDPIQLLEIVRVQLNRSRSERYLVMPGRGTHVLVVDDDPLQRKLAEYHLAGVGFRVTTIEDSTKAIERALQIHPDAIISDVLMEELNGFELCLQIRSHPRLAKLPVVLISSHYSDQTDRELAQRVGANAFVERSGDWSTALIRVQEALSQSAPVHASSDAEHIHEAIQRRTSAQLHRQLRVNAELSQQCLLDSAQLSVLAGVADALARHSKLESVLHDALVLCLDIAGISKGALYLHADVGLRPKHWLGFSESEARRLNNFFGHAELLARMVATTQVTALPSAAVRSEIAQDLLQAAGVNSALVVRVAWGDSKHGALFLGAREADVTGDEPATFARILGGQMGQAFGLADAFERLSTSEEQFRTLVSSMEDVTVSDLSGRVTGIYGLVAQREGLDPKVVVGKLLRELDGPERSPSSSQAYTRARAGDRASYEWSRGAGIEARHYQDSMWPVRNSCGEVVSVVRIRRDITEDKRLQAQVMTSDRMVSLGMLAAGVAHEINNPLMAVLGNLELLRDALGETARRPEIHDALSDALHASKRVEAIVRDLRLFSRAEDERTCSVDLVEVLKSTLRLAQTEIRHRACLIEEFHVCPQVRGNESRLGQVFLNLIVNAAQAIPAGRADSNEIRLVTRMDDAGRAVVEISDTGCGIPDDLAKQLFTPFVTTKPVGVGTGLGLAICQRIVTGLGGRITFQSREGHGSKFSVTLLVDKSSVISAPKGNARSQTPTRRGRVGVIDDDVSLGSLIQRVLQRDHDVVTFTSAAAALSLFEHDRGFDVLFCDLMMPVVTGYEFYQRLRTSAPELADRTVFLTGGTFTAEAHSFLDHVANPIIAKPFDIGALRALVNERIH